MAESLSSVPNSFIWCVVSQQPSFFSVVQQAAFVVMGLGLWGALRGRNSLRDACSLPWRLGIWRCPSNREFLDKRILSASDIRTNKCAIIMWRGPTCVPELLVNVILAQVKGVHDRSEHISTK